MTVTDLLNAFKARSKSTRILPLVIFRICFGLLMAFGVARNYYYNWIHDLYIAPDFHFSYHFFSWVKPLEGNGMYFIFFSLFLLALCMAFGLLWRFTSSAFFLVFCYIELIDKTLYLNHYYFVSIISFILIFTPAAKLWSLDNLLFKRRAMTQIHPWSISFLRLQVAVVYIFAGVAKLNYDWLIKALPLRIWLPAKSNMPFIGGLLTIDWMPYVMSYGGIIYDLTIPFLLLYRKTRPYAFILVIIFHLLTWHLFQIGLFPWVMIISALIFFDKEDYLRASLKLGFIKRMTTSSSVYRKTIFIPKTCILFIILFLTCQIILPLRKHAYEGDNTWHEANYRYSWNVMLAEKTGSVEFTCHNPETGRTWTVYPNEHLTVFQNKQMSFQADMILEYAHYLESLYPEDLVVTASAYVSANGRASQPFIDSCADLTEFESCAFCIQPWILSE